LLFPVVLGLAHLGVTSHTYKCTRRLSHSRAVGQPGRKRERCRCRYHIKGLGGNVSLLSCLCSFLPGG